MSFTAWLGIINFALSGLGTWLLRLPGFDLTPIGIVMIAQGGESVLLGATILTISYMLPSPARFAWIWLQLPVAVLCGYVTLWTGNIYLPILVFHAFSVGVGLLFGVFTGRYLMYTVINIGLNFSVARIYGLVV